MSAAGSDRPSKPNNTPPVENTHESKASRIMYTERAARRAITDLNYCAPECACQCRLSVGGVPGVPMATMIRSEGPDGFYTVR
jgi:hypothetical protein